MGKYCVYIMLDDIEFENNIVVLYSFLKNNTWFDGDIIIGYEYNKGLTLENKKTIENLYYKVFFYEDRFDYQDVLCRNVKEIISLCNFASSTEGYEKILHFNSEMFVISNINDVFEQDYNVVTCSKIYGDGMVYACKSNDIKQSCGDIIKKIKRIIMLEDAEKCNQECIALLTNGFLKNETQNNNLYNISNKTYDIHRWGEYLEDYNVWLNYYILDIGDETLKFKKHEEDKDKYLVITCAKNENAYIREWIQHYLDLNFDKIIICDNNDDESLLDVISDYIEQGIVDVFDYRGVTCLGLQSNIMNMFCSEGNYKWCAYFDCDEFLELGVYSDIKEYLSTKDGDCVCFNWLLFDSNNKIEYEDKPLNERFKLPYFPIINIENSFVKTIMRGGHFKYRCMETNGVHLFKSNGNKNIMYNFGGYYLTNELGDNMQSILPLRYKEGYIKHYYTKSFNEWIKKSERGWGDTSKPLTVSRFFRITNNQKYIEEKYKNSLFLDEDVLDTYEDAPNDDNDNITQFFIYRNTNKYFYPFYVRICRIMYKNKDKVFIIVDDTITEEMVALFLECAFVTGNQIAFVKNDEEISFVFNKYCKGDIIHFWDKSF